MRRAATVSRVLKRAVDIIGALVLLLLAAPVMLLIAVAVMVRLGRPVLFCSVRVGRGRRPFKLYKVRSMTNERDENGDLLPDAERLPRFGRMLRATSLDELPQLWNILRGDMSFIGPRPLPQSYLERYSRMESRRHKMRPGLTGLAQVNGRNSLTWQEKFAYDIEYVESFSLINDLKIVVSTIVVLFRRTGVSSNEHATMPEFLGTPGRQTVQPVEPAAATAQPAERAPIKAKVPAA
jgi:lipopolysaccharide/colanic/teichoic acid biosynthesis glycosyltransferase